eukprot:3308016-Rhodomonas_salina.1
MRCLLPREQRSSSSSSSSSSRTLTQRDSKTATRATRATRARREASRQRGDGGGADLDVGVVADPAADAERHKHFLRRQLQDLEHRRVLHHVCAPPRLSTPSRSRRKREKPVEMRAGERASEQLSQAARIRRRGGAGRFAQRATGG